jgi:hypothetical protein
MKKNGENIQKQIYSTPLVVRVKLDNEISLALQSDPPILPGESISKVQECFNNDMFKTTIG